MAMIRQSILRAARAATAETRTPLSSRLSASTTYAAPVRCFSASRSRFAEAEAAKADATKEGETKEAGKEDALAKELEAKKKEVTDFTV